MARVSKPIKFRFYAGDTEIEKMTPESRAEWENRCKSEIGNVFNNHFSQAPEQFNKL